MGKITGFMEYRRATLPKEPVEKRVRHFQEFEKPLDEETAAIQGARCMDCGIPFCHGDTGCPVDNLIPEWNDLVYRGKWKEALENLHSTNNFPEFTGMLCPAPCESACVLGINEPPVSIKAIERTIIDRGFEEGWVEPRPPKRLTGKTVAIIGSGPAGLAAGQQLARAGHTVTIYDKFEKAGGLLRYGIPDFKMEKWRIDRRLEQMRLEGVRFRTGVHVGIDVNFQEIYDSYDAVILAMGAEHPRDIEVPGRDLNGIHFAMEYLIQANRAVAGEKIENPIHAKGKHVIVLGGGDTGSDCIGTANRQGAKSITQMDYNVPPPENRGPSDPWPLYPKIMRTSTSQEEGVERKWSLQTRGFKGANGQINSLYGVKVHKEGRNIVEIPDSDFELPADLVLISIGFSKPTREGLVDQLMKMGLELDERENVKADFGIRSGSFTTTVDRVYACGDVRRGQSIIVWAISEGRKCATEVHRNLMKKI